MKSITYTIANGPINSNTTPQIGLLFKALRAKYHDRDFTTAQMTEDIVPEVIGTRQDVSRIFAYYQSDMIEDGLLIKNVVTTSSDKLMSNRQIAKNRAIQAVTALLTVDHIDKTVIIDLISAI